MALVGAQEAMHQPSCGKAPDVARNGACVAQAMIRLRHDGWRPMTWEWKESGSVDSAAQYSSASMTVITRTVTAESVGSGDRYFRFRSK
jgi:hypothetical protein